jgi:aminotransferase in exopolysaccharide biosynthesis
MIPLTIPELSGNEWKYVKECLDTGWVSMAGAYVDQFEKIVAEYTGAKYAVAVVNGTCALDITLKMSGVKADDYVIVPNITFIASANSVKYQKANPIFIDVDPQTWQMDLDLLEGFLETKTEPKADNLILKSNGKIIQGIMPVHVLGNMFNIERLMTLAKKYKLEVIEDASESLGTYFKGKHSGTFAKMGVLSFNGNKIITTGGGGMIITDDEELGKRAKHLTTQAKTSPDEYLHDEVAYNYRLVNVLAAIGVAQMEQLPGFIQKKKAINNRYRKGLSGVGDITFQKIEPEVDCNDWLITIQTEKKQMLIDYLNSNGVIVRPFWVPMNQLPMFKEDIYVSNADQSGKVYDTCLSIPSSVGLTVEQQDEVINKIKTFFKK